MPTEIAPKIYVRLLGSFCVTLGEQSLPPLRSRNGLHLLALLALHANRDVSREWLSGTLWPDSREDQALANLRRTLTDLRHALGPASDHLLSPNTHTLVLRLAEDECDLPAFDRACAAEQPDSWRRAIALYRGPLLADSYEAWIGTERAARQESYLHTLERLAQYERAQGAWSEAVFLLRQAITIEPLRESLYADLMETLAQSGDPAEAILVYRTLRLRLHEVFTQAEPGPEIHALYQRIRAEARKRLSLSQVEQVPEPAPANSSFPNNLPQSITAFVGREQEREALGSALDASRLITLVGVGGIGKTRLALETARENGPDFTEGAWFIELAAITDPALLPNAVAAALGLREEVGRPLLQTVQEALRARALLLVLDNCEHLVTACAACVDALLRECPQVRVLATSRQALCVTGEVVWQMSPLPLPSAETLQGGEQAVERLQQCASAQLFIARAQAALPTFRLTAQETSAVAQICRRLDGIPLELAAARLRSLSAAQIAARLDDCFRLLTQGDRSALPRQQTLRALIDWSYEPLSEPERLLFHRLSVFTGSWSLEACEEVCAGEGLETGDILDLLTRLVEESLVVVEKDRGDHRFRLLEILRQYAAEKLTLSGATQRSVERHRLWCVALAERTEVALRAGDQSEALQSVDTDLENVRSALQRPGDPLERLRIAAALGGYWYIRGYLREGRGWLAAGLAECPDAPAPLRSKALKALGDLCWAMADFSEAWRLHEENLQLQEATGDVRGVAYTLISLGLTLYHQGQIAQACDYYERSRDLIRQIGDQRALGVVLTNLAIAQKDRGEYAAAQQTLKEGETLLRELGNLRGLGSNLHSQALIAKRCGDYTAAKVHLLESRALHEQLQDTHGIASAHHTLGEVAYFEGDYTSAQRYYEMALTVFEELGAKRYVAGTLCNLGELMCALGDLESARAFHRRSLQLEREANNEGGALASVQSIAALEQTVGHPENAVLLHAAVMTRFAQRNTPLPPNIQEGYAAHLEQLRATLGEAEYARLWAEGAALSLEEAIAFAAVL